MESLVSAVQCVLCVCGSVCMSEQCYHRMTRTGVTAKLLSRTMNSVSWLLYCQPHGDTVEWFTLLRFSLNYKLGHHCNATCYGMNSLQESAIFGLRAQIDSYKCSPYLQVQATSRPAASLTHPICSAYLRRELAIFIDISLIYP